MSRSAANGNGKKRNRTGLMSSPHAEAMLEVPGLTDPARADGELDKEHARYLEQADSLGSIPAQTPSKTPGGAKAAKALKGQAAATLIDKSAERLAFERTGVRLYQCLLGKMDACGSFDGGPSIDQAREIRDQELQHAQLLTECLQAMGADPTAVTPSADLVGIEGQGLGAVLADARTDVGQSMHALLVAELADREGWTMLCDLARQLGQDDMADRFETAQREEEEHLERVRGWLEAYTRAQARAPV